MRSVSRFLLLSSVFVAIAAPPVFAQGLKINPYPVADDGRVDPHKLDETIVRELLARQQARSIAADRAPLALSKPAKTVVKPKVQPAKGVAQTKTVKPVALEVAKVTATEVVPDPVLIQEAVEPGEPVELKEVAGVKAAPVAPVVQASQARAPQIQPPQVMAPPVSAPQANWARAPQAHGIPALDHVTVIVRPRGQVASPVLAAPVRAALAPGVESAPMAEPALMADSESVVAPAALPMLPPPVEIVERAQVAPEQVVTRAVQFDDVKTYVDRLDRAAHTTPASLQEQAMRRGLQAQSGAIVRDAVDAQAVLGAASYENRNAQPSLSTTTKQLLMEADQILEQQIAQVEQQMEPEAIISPLAQETAGAEAVPLPVLVEPVKALSKVDVVVSKDDVVLPHGNKIIYNPENIKNVMAALTPMPTPMSMPIANEKPVSLLSDDIEVASVSTQPIVLRKDHWRANPGESARFVLGQWAHDADVDLIWKSQFLVDVRQPIEVTGSFEDAVSELLDQYTGLRAGVQGTLHVNKDTGRKLLIIETNGQS